MYLKIIYKGTLAAALIPVWLFHTNMNVHAVHALTGKTMF